MLEFRRQINVEPAVFLFLFGAYLMDLPGRLVLNIFVKYLVCIDSVTIFVEFSAISAFQGFCTHENLPCRESLLWEYYLS